MEVRSWHSRTIRGNLAAGVVAVAFRKDGSGITEYSPAPGSTTITVPGFNGATTQEVVLLLCNTSLPPAANNTATTASAAGGGGGGCFIATAAYGSYLHPKVKVLRHFRDTRLLTNAPGRLLVALYYRVSPPLAAFIAGHDTLRLVSRWMLTPVVWCVEYGALAGMSLCMLGGMAAAGYRRTVGSR